MHIVPANELVQRLHGHIVNQNRKVQSVAHGHVDSEVVLDIVLHLQVVRFGKPTWRRLVEAVEDHVGGNDPVLAQRIARKYPGMLP